MALNATTLKGLMKSKVDAITRDAGSITNDDALQALADAIIEHITSDAEVVVVGGGSYGGVTFPVA